MKLLHIDSSITGANSASRQLSAALVAALKAAIPGLEVIRRDLDANPIPHLDSKRLPTVRPANAPAGAVGIADEGGSDVLDEFLSVDILVIGAPMYNFGIPSQLKAWIDRIAIAGKTFSYTADGPIGLAGGKHVIVASSRGGRYAPRMPFEANDCQVKDRRAISARPIRTSFTPPTARPRPSTMPGGWRGDRGRAASRPTIQAWMWSSSAMERSRRFMCSSIPYSRRR